VQEQLDAALREALLLAADEGPLQVVAGLLKHDMRVGQVVERGEQGDDARVPAVLVHQQLVADLGRFERGRREGRGSVMPSSAAGVSHTSARGGG
jgi:ribosomal protein L13E